jgi:CDP-paratose 2-epimerase
MEGVINRFGCIAGPWQMGKVDQGVMALWVVRHLFNKPLSYIGYGGKGKQVRDFIHIDDVFDILDIQLNNFDKAQNQIFNIGGGLAGSVSLQELTKLCEEATGNKIEIASDPDDRPADLKIYISDNSKVSKTFDWKPKKSVKDIVDETTKWIQQNEKLLVNILG